MNFRLQILLIFSRLLIDFLLDSELESDDNHVFEITSFILP